MFVFSSLKIESCTIEISLIHPESFIILVSGFIRKFDLNPHDLFKYKCSVLWKIIRVSLTLFCSKIYFVSFELTIKGSLSSDPENSSFKIESLLTPFIIFKLIPVGLLVSLSINPIVTLLVLSEPSMHISSFSHEIKTNNVSNILKTLAIMSPLIYSKISIFIETILFNDQNINQQNF